MSSKDPKCAALIRIMDSDTAPGSKASAVRSCKKVTVRIPGEGSSTVSVSEVSAPQIGTGPFAVRLTATSGSLEGLEITMVTTGVGDVVAALTFVALPDDVDGATDAAVGKAQQVLVTKSGT